MNEDDAPDPTRIEAAGEQAGGRGTPTRLLIACCIMLCVAVVSGTLTIEFLLTETDRFRVLEGSKWWSFAVFYGVGVLLVVWAVGTTVVIVWEFVRWFAGRG